MTAATAVSDTIGGDAFSLHAARIAPVAGAFVAALGGLVLVGWAADIAALKCVIPGMVTMKANTAVCFLLAGMALLLGSRDLPTAYRRLGSGLAAFVAVVGALSFYEYAAGVDLGIDQLLFRDEGAIATSHPGRMAATTALCFALIGVSLALLAGRSGGLRFATAPVIAAGALATFDFLGYICSSTPTAYPGYTRMAIHTSVAFILLAAGIVPAVLRTRHHTASDRRETARAFSRQVASLGGILAGVVLFGWWTRTNSLSSFIPGEMMHPKTAVAYLLISIGLLLRIDPVVPRARSLADLLAIAGIGIGLLYLLQAIFGIEVGLDRFLVRAHDGLSSFDETLTYAFPLSAVAVTLLAAALFLLGRERWADSAAILGMITASVMAASLSLLGYLFAGPGLIGIPGLTRMSFPSTVCALLLGIGMVASRPERGMMRLLVSDYEGGRIARRVLPVVILAPIAIGILRQRGEMAGLFDWQFGIAVMILGSLSVILPVVWLTAQAVDRSDEERERIGSRFKNIFELSSDMICVAGADGLFKAVNPAWTATLGYSSDELAGKPFFDFIHPDDLEKTKAMVAAQTAGSRAVEFENRYMTKDGTPRHLLWAATPVMEDQCIYAIARDITSRKEAEQERERLLGQLTAANKELDAFTYSVSHDLRAPLRAIDGFTKRLIKTHGDRLDDEGRRLLTVVCDSTKTMSCLIDDLLEFSRLGRQSMARTIVDMNVLAREVLGEAVATAIPRTQVTIGDLPPAPGDPRLFRQIWANLIGNAVKYSGKTEAPRIEIGSRRESREIVYWVKDNGAGFDMRYVEKLFGVFQRLHPQSEFAGTGVGLALVQRIVTRHGGRIRAEGEVGKGATFEFTLPAEI